MSDSKDEDVWSCTPLVYHLLCYLNIKEHPILYVLSKTIKNQLDNKISLWEKVLNIPKKTSSLSTCFCRAMNSYRREEDRPPPNVNRIGQPVYLHGMIWNENTNVTEYATQMKRMFREEQCLRQHTPISFSLPLPIPSTCCYLLSTTSIIIGGLYDNIVSFWKYEINKNTSILRGSLRIEHATAYHSDKKGLVVSCVDGSIKLYAWSHVNAMGEIAPISYWNHRCSFSVSSILMPSKSKITHVLIHRSTTSSDKSSSRHSLLVASAIGNGDVQVWDAIKNEPRVYLDHDEILFTKLTKGKGPSGARISYLSSFSNKLIIGTTRGLLRVYDLRNGKISFRVCGHAGSVVKTVTNGGALWSGGHDGAVHQWGSKRARVLDKDGHCSGAVTCMEVCEDVIVVGYGKQGMCVWDMKFQQHLLTFRNRQHEGFASLCVDTTKILSLSTSGEIAFWRWFTPQKPLFYLKDGPYSTLCVTNEGLLVCTTTGVVQLYLFNVLF